MAFDSYSYDLSFLTPVDRLPPELLVDVFEYCVEAPGDDLIPLTLGIICHYWRNVAHTSSRIWQHIYLTDRRKIEVSHVQARMWAVRAGSLPLHVHVNLVSRDMLLPLLSPILPHISRWRTCGITIGDLTEYIDFSALAADGPKSSLEHLQVVVRGVYGAEPFAHHLFLDEDDSHMPTFTSIPSIHSSDYHDVFMRVTLVGLPLPLHMSTLYLTRLTITESFEVCTDATRMLNFLSVLPVLERFVFYGFPHEGSPDDDASKPPIVSLLRLRVLVLRSTCSVRTILSHLHAPALSELYLEHTNIDFEMRHDAYANIREDGDSEDEAHDFSQSPWSDRATGMGLRSLVRRSSPPLEILEMDYADMRTKDFLWCFDRLDTLREFRIVASDMSDSVIKLLAPVVANNPPHSATTGVDTEAVGSVIRVRLPRLSTLGLWNCQRLSGDAVVAALRSRAAYTDAALRAMTSLTDVAVVDCSGFSVHHALLLSPVLGDRLRTV